MAYGHETIYRDRLGVEAAIDVHFVTDRSGVIDYAIVLLARQDRAWVAVRVYDNTHGTHDMHRYNRDGIKQAAETFHQGSAGEAMRSALETVRGAYNEVIESWRR